MVQKSDIVSMSLNRPAAVQWLDTQIKEKNETN